MRTKCRLESLRGRDHSEDLGVDRIILKWILGNRIGGCGLDSLGLGPMADYCKHGNEPSGSIKGGEFLDSSSWSLFRLDDDGDNSI
jgi:hypothetical protein